MVRLHVAQEIKSEKTSVPWTGIDVLLFLAIWFAPLIVSVASAYIIPLHQPHVQTAAEAKNNHGHPIVQLVEQSKNSPIVFWVAFMAVVIAAPLIEEFLFRMLFQGWLEATLRQVQVPYASGIAIVVVSGLFATIHMNNHRAIDAQALLNGLVASIVFSLLVFTAGVMYLIQMRNVRIANYVFVTERLFHPRFFTGVGYCLLVILFCLALNAALTKTFPGTNVAPISLFFFSLALGVLYSKTQNLSYCVLFHACLNGISLACVWSMSSGT